MIDEALVHERLAAIDKEVMQVLTEQMPEYGDVAAETYRFGLFLRDRLLAPPTINPVRRSALEELLRNESFYRLMMLLIVLALRSGSGPLLRALSRYGR